MKPNRDDLLRRLTITEVPKPPDDLLSRLKADIPNPLPQSRKEEPVRFWNSWGISWQAAAAAIAIVTFSFLSLHVLRSNRMIETGLLPPHQKSAAPQDLSRRPVGLPPASEAYAPPPPQARSATPAGTAESIESPRNIAPTMVPQPTIAFSPQQEIRDMQPREETSVQGGVEGGVLGAVAGGVTGGSVSGAAPAAPAVMAEKSAADTYAPAPPATAQRAVTAMAAPSMQATMPRAKREAKPRALGYLEADEIATTPFPLEVGTASYTEAKRTLEAGRLPRPDSIRVEEFVNYFTYKDPAPRNGSVALYAEGAPAPFPRSVLDRVVRFGIRGSEQEQLRDVSASVEFNSRVVSRYRSYGFGSSEQTLGGEMPASGRLSFARSGYRLAAAYQIRLHPDVRPSATVATLRLHYRDDSGRLREVEKKLLVSDLAPSWEKAAPSLKLASLVAEFAESLRASDASAAPIDEIARRAQIVSAYFAGDDSVAEFVVMSGTAARLQAVVR